MSLVRAGSSDEVKGHGLSTLVTMVTHHQEAVLECRKEEEVSLKSALTQLAAVWSGGEQHEVRGGNTVEPPNKGHFGAKSLVPCREVVPISEVE